MWTARYTSCGTQISYFFEVLYRTLTVPGSYFDPHPSDILGLEGPGVLEAGITILASRPPFSDLAVPL